MVGVTKSLSELSFMERPSRPSEANESQEGRYAKTKCGLTSGSTEGCKNKILWIVVSIVLAAPRSALACAACTGRSDDAAAHGLNATVFTLLFVLLLVYGAIGSFLTYLIRRAVKHPVAQPDVRELVSGASHWAKSATESSRATVNRVVFLLPSLNRKSPRKNRKERYENGRN